jgi:uncharacterized membrane protein YfcA
MTQCGCALGLLAGTRSGLIGVGGGVIVVPALVFFFKLTQHRAEDSNAPAPYVTQICGTLS